MLKHLVLSCVVLVSCGVPIVPGVDAGIGGGGGTATGGGTAAGGGTATGGGGGSSTTLPTIAGCSILPANHVFNTPIDTLPVHPSSTAFMSVVGVRNIHLDLGQQETQSAADYYGIPYNVVNASTLTWSTFAFLAGDPNLDWDPSAESDCAIGSAHTITSPCVAGAAPMPQFPIPPNPLVEGGLVMDGVNAPYGDHHMLVLDSSSCRLWEAYHAYTSTGPWHFFGTATFDLNSNALRPASWTSADAAGFPILPLLLRPDEASAGAIRHALRFTIPSGSIRRSYVWPATHFAGGATSTNNPQMGQLFRLKASYVIPSSYSTQSKAILQALKTYGMYLSDGGSSMYVQGIPSANWSDSVFSEVQSVSSTQFEAVDIGAITSRTGFDASSAAVPP